MLKKIQTLVIISVVLFMGQFRLSAQSAPEVDSRKIIDKGVELHDNQKYAEAEIEFKKISRNDTNYVLAATELINTYITNGKDSLAVELCNSLLDIPSSYIPNIMSFKANALDDMKRSDEAIKVYEEGMKKFPLNYSFSYELGILKLRQEKYREAQDYFVKSLKINPYHANTHFQLGLIASKQGKLLPTMLAWQFYLTIDNTSDRAKSIVGALEKMSQNEYDFGKTVQVEELDNQDDFSEIETLVKSKVALGSKYKSQTKLNFNISKQIQLIMEKLEIDKNDKGFFMQFYAPFFKELYKNKMMEAYTYYILSGMGNEDVDKWMKKNAPASDAFINWIVAYLGPTFCTWDENLNGQTVKAEHFYSKANLILAVGNMNSKKQKIGYWNYYYSNGIKKSEGSFNNNDQRQGLWKFYFQTGLLKSIENYVDGKADGPIESYFSNGSIKSKRNFKNDLMDGDQAYYYSTGCIKIVYPYKANVENGKEKKYYKNGQLEYELNVVDGNYEGDLVQFYINGHVKQKVAFKAGKRTGKCLEYYNFPENTISTESFYDKGILTGVYKTFHQNGNLSESGEYDKDGEKTGIWKSFNPDNILIEEETYNKGKNSGISKNYTNKGLLSEEFIYKNNMLQEYKAFDATGKEFYQNKKEGKNNYDVLLYYQNGNKRREGKVKDGKLDGNWKNYNINGYVNKEENYAAGQKEGKFISYWENGKVKSETNYVQGETDGYYREYYKNGTLKKEGAYIKDKAIGIWNNYYPNGAIKTINFYKDDSNDNWQQYFSSNGKLEAEDYIELNYVKKRVDYDSLSKVTQVNELDKGTGILDIKYENGKPYWKVNYKNDLKQGAYNAFYMNGNPMATKNYVNDELDGVVKYYYPSGKLKTEENYTDGNLNGKKINYYENGNVKNSYEYVYGNLNGKSYYYYPNSQVQVEYNYKNDLLDGKTISYSETGEVMIVKNFEEDILVSYQYTDKTGNLTAPILVKNETGAIKAYYKSGNPSIEYTIKNGCIEGNRITYHPNGKIADQCNFICDDREGILKSYFPSGKLKLMETWKNDDRFGSAIAYYENGKVKSEENYINDARFGPFKYYDETGKLIKTYIYYDDKLIYEN